jgi:hypothetical protein
MGEQFLNYPLHTELREFLGVDISGVRLADPADAEWEQQRGSATWERWERNWMGYKTPPIEACSGRFD